MTAVFYDVKPLKEVPDTLYWQFLEYLEEKGREKLSLSRQNDLFLKELRKSFIDEYHALIGSQYLPRYLKLHNRRITEMNRVKNEFGIRSDGFKKYEEMRQKYITGTNALIQRAGVRRENISYLFEKYHKQYRDYLSPKESGLETPISAESGVKNHISTIDIEPPMLLGQLHFDHGSCSQDWYYTWSSDLNTGKIFHVCDIAIHNADNSESGLVEGETCLFHFFYVPETCFRLVIKGKFISDLSWYYIDLADECGLSDCSVTQKVTPYFVLVRASGELVCETNFLHYYPKGGSFWGGSHFESGYLWPRGQHIETDLVEISNTMFEKGELVLFGVGVKACNKVHANDYSLQSAMTNELRIKRVSIQLFEV